MRWILLLLLVGCSQPDVNRWLESNGYIVLERHDVPQPTIGPDPCFTGYRAEMVEAVRYPVPEERCATGVRVRALVCCKWDRCYLIERERTCYRPIPGESSLLLRPEMGDPR